MYTLTISTLFWSVGCALMLLAYMFAIDVRRHYKSFKHVRDNSDEFMLEYSDCPDLASTVALFLIRKKSS